MKGRQLQKELMVVGGEDESYQGFFPLQVKVGTFYFRDSSWSLGTCEKSVKINGKLPPVGMRL